MFSEIWQMTTKSLLVRKLGQKASTNNKSLKAKFGDDIILLFLSA